MLQSGDRQRKKWVEDTHPPAYQAPVWQAETQFCMHRCDKSPELVGGLLGSEASLLCAALSCALRKYSEDVSTLGCAEEEHKNCVVGLGLAQG